MNYVLIMITALLLAINITAPLHAAAARAYQPLRQAYLRSTRTLSPATRRALGTTLGRYQPFLTGQMCRRMSTAAGTTSNIDISPYLTSLENLRIQPLVEGYQPAFFESDRIRGFKHAWTANIAGWDKQIEQAWQKSPAEYLRLFSPRNIHSHVKLWQIIMLKDLSARITSENAPLLLDALLKESNIKDIDPNVASIIFTVAQQDKDAARSIVASANETNLHQLLMNKAGGNLIANIMTPEFASHMAQQITNDPDYIKYGRSSFFNVASQILSIEPATSNKLIEAIGKTFKDPFPFSTAIALQIVKEHPETSTVIYHDIKKNFLQILKLADNWNQIRMVSDEVNNTLGTENRAIELINNMLQHIPAAQHDFYSIITNYPDRIQSQSPAVKALIANIKKGERPRMAKDACKTALGLATAGGIGYGLYKAYGEDEQPSRVQE